MNRIIKIEQSNNAPFFLTWIINNICPNQCSYCPDQLHNGKNHHFDWGKALKFFDELFKRYGKVFCSVAGGEPSVSPFLPEIVKIFYKNGSGINLTSNGAKSVDFWKDLSNYVTTINFSWHPEFQDKDFIKKVIESSKNTRVNVRVMMYKKYWNEAVSIFNDLKKLTNLDFISPVRIQNWGNNKDIQSHLYEDYQLDWFNNNQAKYNFIKRPNFLHPGTNLKFFMKDETIVKNPAIIDYINNGYTNFKGYSCDVGLKHLYVNFKGEIYRGNCLEGGLLGRIDEIDNIKWPENSIICNKSICNCGSDVLISKFMLR